MLNMSYIRSSLLASALLLSTSLAVPAFAQSTVALPDLSPSDIARDVKREFNNRSGTSEFIAPTFDPFEQDSQMAGSVSLRSVDAPITTIDGDVYAEGVLMDMAFYYNAPNDDPFGGRGFTDAAFLSGSLAPAVRRDQRILECSRNVRDVVYDHTYYYAPSFAYSFYRPLRFYGGHYRFGRFDRPYWRNRSVRHRGFVSGRNSGWSRSVYSNRNRHSDRVRDRRFDDRNDRNRDRTRESARDNRRGLSDTAPVIRSDRRGRMGVTTDQRQPRARNNDTTNRLPRTRADVHDNIRRRQAEERRSRSNNNETRSERRDDRSRSNVLGNPSNTNGRARVNLPQSRDNAARDRVIGASTRRDTNTTRRSQPRTETRPAPRRAETRSETRRTETRRTETRRSEPRRTESRPAPRRTETRSQTRSRVTGGKRSQGAFNTIKANRGIRRTNDFFPKRSSYGREVVRSVDIDCAREDTLTVFIPRDRFEAAKFDGLTVLALDNQGQEYPIFVPPKYLEGFDLARGNGAVRYQADPQPSRIYQAPTYRDPIPSPSVTAPCPTGTQKQPDGSCLLVSRGGYP